ncbi:hypothetical protein TRICI_004207 [Trichomonascus ciferrii]|uniref:Cell wall protein n=1 Tax=Trichomonascus ciferrii TaxID=44093 RepID=A0A642V1H9_9ASCO|nr:hypothetical protein TRICI_004207 [Trichomonascus ciferrii]
MVVPTKTVPALLLFATAVAADADNLLDKRAQGNDKASQMFQAASRLATVVGSSTGMTKASKVDSKTMQDSVICPLAEDVADMVSKALKEAGDNPQGQTRGMMNKLVGISRGIENVANSANVDCDGLTKFKDQADKVKSAVQSNNHKRDNDSDDDYDDDDDNDTDYDSDFEDDDYNDYDTGKALAVSNKQWMGVFKGVEHLPNLPEDYLCDAIGTSAKSVDKMNEEVGSNANSNTKNLVDNGVVRTGKSFTSNAKDNGVKCDSEISALNKSLNKKSSGSSGSSSSMSGSSSSSSGSATASSMSTKASQTASSSGSATSSGSQASSTASGSSSESGSSTQDADSGAAGLTNNAAFLGAGAIAALALL